MTSSELKVAICVPTYNRPEYFSGLLSSLEAARIDGFQAVLVIVDNDPSGSAKEIVERHEQRLPFLVHYCVEPARGLANVRNRLVKEARAIGADFIAFVDDDEEVEPEWLYHLMTLQERTGAPLVWGSVVPLFEEGVPDYIRNTGFFDQKSFRTGDIVPEFATNNLLLRLEIVDDLPGPFDLRRNLVGGDDARLAVTLRRRGHRAIRCAESITHENIGITRGTARWIVRRRFMEGFTEAITLREDNASTLELALKAGRAVAVAAKHALLLIPRAISRGRSGLVVSVAGFGASSGILAGLIGLQYKGYKKTYGR